LRLNQNISYRTEFYGEKHAFEAAAYLCKKLEEHENNYINNSIPTDPDNEYKSSKL